MKVKLGDIAILINGDRGKNYPSQADIVLDGDVPFVNAGHLNGRNINFSEMNYISKEKYAQLNSGKFREGDILYCLRGSLGKKAVVNSSIQGAIASSLVIIRPDSTRVDVDYLMFALDSPSIQEQLIKANNGSSQPNLSAASVRGYEVDLPDKKIQEDIVDKLSKVRAIIDARQQELQKLDDLIKARFVELFGDPATNEKGFIKAPMGDYMTLLTDFSSNGSYKTLDSGVTMYDEPNFAWMVRTTDLESGDMTAIKYIDENAYELLAKSKIYGGEIIMNKIGSAGKIYLMPQIDMPASLGRNAFMFRYDERINVKFLYHLLTSEYGQREIQQYVRGAVTKTITKNDARAVLIIVPPIELQNEFEALVEQVDKSKFAVQKALEETQILFDSLMQEYFG